MDMRRLLNAGVEPPGPRQEEKNRLRACGEARESISGVYIRALPSGSVRARSLSSCAVACRVLPSSPSTSHPSPHALSLTQHPFTQSHARAPVHPTLHPTQRACTLGLCPAGSARARPPGSLAAASRALPGSQYTPFTHAHPQAARPVTHPAQRLTHTFRPTPPAPPHHTHTHTHTLPDTHRSKIKPALALGIAVSQTHPASMFKVAYR